MISPHKTPALAKLAMLLLFAIAAVAILDTTSISAQEPGRTITSPFGVANPYMNASDASESGSDGDTFVDPETGEVGHIIRNPFGVANPEGVDTGIDIPDDAGEEVGGIITSPFGVPASDDIDTGVDVFDEDEEYLISLPDDEEVDTEESEDVDEVEDETSDDGKEIEEESSEDTAEEKYIPVKDNPIRGIEDDSFQFSLIGTMQMDDGTFSTFSVESETNVINNAPTLYVRAGKSFKLTLASDQPLPQNFQPTVSFGDANHPELENPFEPPQSGCNPPYQVFWVYNAPSAIYGGTYCVSVSGTLNGETVERVLKIEVVYFSLKIDYNDDGEIDDNDVCISNSFGKIIHINNLDVDHDGIPDYADGFQCWCHYSIDGLEYSTLIPGASSSINNSLSFEKIRIRVSKGLDLTQWYLSFYYDQSDFNVNVYGNVADPKYRTFEPRGAGTIRLWTKDGVQARSGSAITSLLYPGDSIPSNINADIPLVKFASNRIEKNDYDEYTLYVEAVKTLDETADKGAPITVSLKKGNNNNTTFHFEDEIYVTPYQVIFEGITNEWYSGGTHNVYYNPCGLVRGGYGKFRFTTIPTGIPASSFTWTASANLRFINGSNTEKIAYVQADNNSDANDYSLEINIGRGDNNPKIEGEILEDEKRVKLFVWIVADNIYGYNAAFRQGDVYTWVNKVNDIYMQVGIKYEVAEFNYIADTTGYFREIEDDPTGEIGYDLVQYPQSTNFPRTEDGLEIFFISDLGDARGVTYPGAGIIIPETAYHHESTATYKTLAHELGHACDLLDIYDTKGNSTLSDKMNPNSLWIKKDCTYTNLPNNNPFNNTMSVAGYYESNLKHVDLVKRLLMYGYGSGDESEDLRGDLSSGDIFGIDADFNFVDIKTGLEGMVRTPTHGI